MKEIGEKENERSSSSAISFMVACKESCPGGGTLGLRVEIVQNDSLSRNENKI
jgi:hypothetical protein